MSVYSAHRYMAIAAMFAVLLPSALWALFQDDTIHAALAIGSGLFIVASLRAATVLSNALHRSFRLSAQKTPAAVSAITK